MQDRLIFLWPLKSCRSGSNQHVKGHHMSPQEGLTLRMLRKPLLSSNIQLALLQLCSPVHLYLIIGYGKNRFLP
jgi:hypothetical protein